MKKLFYFLLLMLVSSSALAATAAVDPMSDVSIGFLSQIFGTVGNVLSGTSGQLLGKMFGIFNAGVLAIASIWLAYTVGSFVLRSAQEGSFMGQNKNAAVLMLRIALGFALTIPSPTTGYSLVQVGVMQAVVGGVSLANNTWSAVLQYMADGGTLYALNRPGKDTLQGLNEAAQQLFATQGTQGLGVGWKIFTAEVCMARANAYRKTQLDQTGNSSSYGQQYTMVIDQANNVLKFPGKDDTLPLASNKDGACGSVEGIGGKGSVEKAGGATFAAVYQMAERMYPAAQRFADCKIDSKSYCGTDRETNDTIKMAMLNALLGYYTLIQPYVQVENGKALGFQEELKDKAKTFGWILAGRYYWDLMRINDSYEAATSITSYLPSMRTNPTDNTFMATGGDGSRVRGEIGTWGKNNSKLAGQLSQVVKNYLQGRNDSGTNAIKVKDVNTSIDVGGDAAAVADGMSGIFVDLFGGFNKLVGTFKSIDPNPIAFLMKVGRYCLNVASAIWFAGMLTIISVAVFAGICASTSPLPTIFDAILTWIKPVIFGIAAALLVPGFVLGYYLPLYPYLLFTFGAIGWLILVLEAIVAAPLVAFGMTHPDNHDLLGKAEQGLMLILSVFLRPVLMVIGLIGGMMLSYAALKLLLLGFTGILLDLAHLNGAAPASAGGIFSNAISSGGLSHGGAVADSTANIWSGVSAVADSGDFGDAILKLVIITVLLVVFSSIVYKVVQQSYSLIFELPNNIMQWIGAPSRGDNFTAQATHEIEANTRSATGTMGQQMGGAVQGFAEGAGRQAGQGIKQLMGKSSNSKGSSMDQPESSAPSGGAPPAGDLPVSSAP